MGQEYAVTEGRITFSVQQSNNEFRKSAKCLNSWEIGGGSDLLSAVAEEGMKLTSDVADEWLNIPIRPLRKDSWS